MTYWLGLIALGAVLATAPTSAAERTILPAPAGESEVIAIHGATDFSAMQPLLRDFQVQSPHTTVEYTDYVTSELFEAVVEACRTGKLFADIVLSSAVDQLVKLANDGCASPHRSAETVRVANWATWRDEVFGFTFEPAVIVYNTSLIAADEVPRSHLELIDLLRKRADRFRGRIGTYDIRLSGIGYLFAYSDLQQTSTTYGRLLESMGRAKAVVRCCTSEILDEVASGRLLIGYNLLGSYAYSRVRQGAPITIVLPQDYTLVLARGALIPKPTRRAELGGRFLDYLLSERGQRIARHEAFFFAANSDLPSGVEGPASLPNSGRLRPITIGPNLLPVQDRARRARFISDWSRSMIEMDNSN